MEKIKELTNKIKRYDRFKLNKTIAVFLYGSTVTGDSDENSDIDIVVVKDRYECEDKELEKIISEIFDKDKIDISFYGRNKFENLLKCGSLFCHHLKNESRLLYSRNNNPISYYFNNLKDFKGIAEDILLYNRLFKKTKESIFNAGVNYYDLCILGMIARNTLTVLSYKNNPQTCKFGKYEVYKSMNSEQVIIDRYLYDELMSYRSFYKRFTPYIELPNDNKLELILEGIKKLLNYAIIEAKVEGTIDRLYHLIEDNSNRNFYTTFEIFVDLDRDLYFDLKYYLNKVYNYDLKNNTFEEVQKFAKEYNDDRFLLIVREVFNHISRIKTFSSSYEIDIPKIDEIKKYNKKNYSRTNKFMSRIKCVLKHIGLLDCVDSELKTKFVEVLKEYIELRDDIYQK